MHQRKRCIKRRARAQRREEEDETGEGKGETKKRNKSIESQIDEVDNEGELCGRVKRCREING